MAIYLVRHGETQGNKDKVLQFPHTPLSAKGQQQAQLLAKAFQHIKLTHILSSDHVRAEQTAAPLAQMKNISVVREPRLRERNFGALRGTAYAQLTQDIFATDYIPPNGESYADFAKRVAKVWQSLIKDYAEPHTNIVIVTHGLVLRELISQHLIATTMPKITDLANCSITQVDSVDAKMLVSCGDCQHLN
ncbi:histidine phosphatase family protein [Paraglaciecola aestuariivivens]